MEPHTQIQERANTNPEVPSKESTSRWRKAVLITAVGGVISASAAIAGGAAYVVSNLQHWGEYKQLIKEKVVEAPDCIGPFASLDSQVELNGVNAILGKPQLVLALPVLDLGFSEVANALCESTVDRSLPIAQAVEGEGEQAQEVAREEVQQLEIQPEATAEAVPSDSFLGSSRNPRVNDFVGKVTDQPHTEDGDWAGVVNYYWPSEGYPQQDLSTGYKAITLPNGQTLFTFPGMDKYNARSIFHKEMYGGGTSFGSAETPQRIYPGFTVTPLTASEIFPLTLKGGTEPRTAKSIRKELVRNYDGANIDFKTRDLVVLPAWAGRGINTINSMEVYSIAKDSQIGFVSEVPNEFAAGDLRDDAVFFVLYKNGGVDLVSGSEMRGKSQTTGLDEASTAFPIIWTAVADGENRVVQLDDRGIGDGVIGTGSWEYLMYQLSGSLSSDSDIPMASFRGLLTFTELPGEVFFFELPAIATEASTWNQMLSSVEEYYSQQRGIDLSIKNAAFGDAHFAPFMPDSRMSAEAEEKRISAYQGTNMGSSVVYGVALSLPTSPLGR